MSDQELRPCLQEACDLMEDVYRGEYTPDSLTTQPWRIALQNNEWSSKDTQVGGSHYKDMPLQPWEIIEKNNLDFWEGNALKYLLRYKSKNGAQDLEKAKHYIDYLIERENSK